MSHDPTCEMSEKGARDDEGVDSNEYEPEEVEHSGEKARYWTRKEHPRSDENLHRGKRNVASSSRIEGFVRVL